MSLNNTNANADTNFKNRLSACNLLRSKYTICVDNKKWVPNNGREHHEKNLWNILKCEDILFNLKIPPVVDLKYNQGYYGKLWHNLLYS